MQEKIKEQLREIEQKYKVKVLYACETGSRAWGFPSPDSDYDVRMIYMHETDWYLSLSDKKDSIEMMMENGDLDISGWDFKKSLQLLWKCNGALLERIQSPIIYRNTEGFTGKFQSYAEKCFAPVAVMHHYLGMAKNSFDEVQGREEVKLKKLFYALRATLACKWVLEKDSIPPIVFQTMVNELDFDESLKNRIEELVKLKSGKNESYMHPAENELSVFIEEQLRIASEKAPHLPGRKSREVDLDDFFREGLRTWWK